MSDNTSSLVLGTAQLGMSYGIANSSGQPDQMQATAIIGVAWKNGIREFDTAQAYGESERVLGKAFDELGIGEDVRVVSKLDPQLNHLDESVVSRAVDESLERLTVPKLHCLMLHSEEKLSQWNRGLGDILRRIVAAGKTQYIGVSVYSPDKALQALDADGVDCVQLPANILDRRFADAGVFQSAEEKGKRIYVRSVFLQGLLLMAPEDLPVGMQHAKPTLERVECLSEMVGLEREEIAFAYIRSEAPNASVVFGAETREQVEGSVNAWSRKIPEGLSSQVRSSLGDVDERILNPNLWSG